MSRAVAGGARRGVAAVFPGQGAQRPGMGRCLAEQFPACRRVFEEVDEALQLRLSRDMFGAATAEELRDTAVAQPAVLAHSIAVWRLLRGEGALEGVEAAAGHSLGEFTALCAAGALPLADAARLVRARGEAINEAVRAAGGAGRGPPMLALMPCDAAAADETAREAARETGLACALANVNTSRQAVLSGHADAVRAAARIARARGVRRAVPLDVGAPFHSPLLEGARAPLRRALEAVEWAPLEVPVVTNEAAEVLPAGAAAPGDLAGRLERHLVAPVQWLACMRAAGGLAGSFLELGPAAVLSPMLRGELEAGAGVQAVCNAEQASAWLLAVR